MTQLTKLFEPANIGKMQLKNRLIMAPMGGMGDLEGNVIERCLPYYAARARGGVAMIICQSSVIAYEWRAPGRLATYDDKFLPGLRKLARTIQESGAKAAVQVVHHGKLLSQWRTYYEHPEEIDVVGASAIPWQWNNVAPREATEEDIEHMVEAFGEASRRIKEAGFDAVEILGAHGYLITQFLSPLTNQRKDKYGGSVENRARFACDIIRRIRAKVGPDYPVLMRISGSEFVEGGITVEDTVCQAPMFVEAGVDALHVSSSAVESTHWTNPSYLFPDGNLVHLAEAVKKAVNVPVIAVGKIGDPLFAERIIQEGKADFVAMGRALLADPELPNKAREGRLDEIVRCIYCNNCHDTRWRKRLRSKGISLSCTVNPSVLREEDFALELARSPKKIMVIGGGLAGMEAARALAARGHTVSLYEKADKLGGQWNIASQQDMKEGYASVIRDRIRGLEKAEVEVLLNQEVTADLVRQKKPDAVVVATGATPRGLNVPGADLQNVVQAVDVIQGKAKVGNEVVVVGGRFVGMETALHLAKQGKKVSLVTERELGQNDRFMERNIKLMLRDLLIEHGVYIYTHSPVQYITERGVVIATSRELTLLKADTVVLAVGAKSESKLVEEIKGVVPEVYAIGDCVEPRDAMEAIGEGAEIGRRI